MSSGQIVAVLAVAVLVAALVLAVLRRRDRATDLIASQLAERQAAPDRSGPPGLDRVALERRLGALLDDRRKIEAIKLLRDNATLSLADAKRAVEEVERTGRLPMSAPFAAPGVAGSPFRPAFTPPGMAGGTLDPHLLARVRDLKYRRRAIEAIKLIREHTGLGLKQAKDVYDTL
jgi:ribosomal protein L7/L12